eukprot:1376178-Pyramimonas_sp.AAC.1
MSTRCPRATPQALQRSQISEHARRFPIGRAAHAHLEIQLHDARGPAEPSDGVEIPEPRGLGVPQAPVTPTTRWHMT